MALAPDWKSGRVGVFILHVGTLSQRIRHPTRKEPHSPLGDSTRPTCGKEDAAPRDAACQRLRTRLPRTKPLEAPARKERSVLCRGNHVTKPNLRSKSREHHPNNRQGGVRRSDGRVRQPVRRQCRRNRHRTWTRNYYRE